MRKLIVCIAIAGCLAGSTALAAGGGGGGQGGGQGGGHGGGMGGQGGGMGGGMSGGMGGGMDGGMGGGMGGDHLNGRANSDLHGAGSSDPRSALRGDNANTPQQAMFGRSTAERARMLKDADLATRQAFGQYQSSLAKSQGNSHAPVSDATQNQVQIYHFVADTSARAKELKGADIATRTSFGAIQASLAREQGLERAAGTVALNAAFGQQTASRAKLQRDADVATRKTFGTDQSTRAKAKHSSK